MNIFKLLEESAENNKISVSSLYSINSSKTYDRVLSYLSKKGIEVVDDCTVESNDITPLPYIYTSYFSDISKYPLLSSSQEKMLFSSYKNGDNFAREALVNCNLRLVVHIAKRYYDLAKINNIEFFELIQEGNEGLIRAVDMFDLKRGTRLSTYAAWWIRKRIVTFLSNSNNFNNLSENKGYTFNSKEELMERLVNSSNTYMDNDDFEQESDDYLSQSYRKNLSLDWVYVEDNNISLKDLFSILDDSIEKVNDAIYYEYMWKVIKECLTDVEFKIILDRVGKKIGSYGSDDVLTLEQISTKQNITKHGVGLSRVNNLEKKAMRKIRNVIYKY